MKKNITFLCLLLISSIGLFGQVAYNPFTQNIHFAPEPTPAGFGCGTVQTLVFTQGITTIDDATQWLTEPLKVKICIAGFEFNGPASSIVTGSYSGNFNWAFDISNPNCIVGTQNQTLFGTGSNPLSPNPLATGEIILSLKVPNTSPANTILSIDVTLDIPSYMSTFNSLTDDNESTMTQTYCIPTVPTMSEWSLIIVALLSLSFGMIFIVKNEMTFVYEKSNG